MPLPDPVVAISLLDTLLVDVSRQRRVSGRCDDATSGWEIVRELPNHRFHPVVLLRLSLWFSGRPTTWTRALGKVLSFVNARAYGVEVALQSEIGPGLYLPHAGGIVMGAASIGRNATIFQGVTLGATALDLEFDPDRRPRLGDGVTISAGAKVLGGVTIGDGAIVGANAVVVKDVPPGDVVGGVPARTLRTNPEATSNGAPS